MSTAVSVESRIGHIVVTDETITAHLVDGRVISVPLAWSWRLSDATPAQRANWQLIGEGHGVHWPDVDEDLSADGLLNGVPARRPPRNAAQQSPPNKALQPTSRAPQKPSRRNDHARLAAERQAVRRTTKDSGMRAGLLGLLVIASTACSRNGAPMEESLRNQIVHAVQQRMLSFEAAERALDAEKLIGHFSRGPEFYIYNDGQRLTYDVMSAAVRGAFPTLRSIDGGFEDLDIKVLAPDAVLVTAKFQETVTDRSGNTTVQHGAASWLWRQMGGEWRIAYGHVDHYPGASTKR